MNKALNTLLVIILLPLMLAGGAFMGGIAGLLVGSAIIPPDPNAFIDLPGIFAGGVIGITAAFAGWIWITCKL